MGKEIGIDFGTTNTVVSYVNKKGRLRQLSYEQKEIIPSVIYFHSENDYEIGYAAKKLMENLNPKAGVASFKPMIGDNSRRIEIVPDQGKPFRLRAYQIAKYFLNKVVDGIGNRLIREFGPIEGCIERAVITVPAKFSSTEKSSTRQAARQAGLGMVQLVAEPTAAAVAWENDQGMTRQDNTVLVYDFGGGTFDVSIIQRSGGAYREIETGGDEKLGGDTLTKKLMAEIFARVNDDYGLELPTSDDDFDEDYHQLSHDEYQRDRMEIRRVANIIKERLSEENSVEESLNILLPNGKSDLMTLAFDRDELESILLEDIERTVDITAQAIARAEEKGCERIDQIVLAGGSSNIPLVRQKLEEKLGELDVIYSDDVSTLISRGAAILARSEKELDSISQAITNVEMGVAATEGVQFGKFQMIIPADAPLPCTGKRRFSLGQDGRQRMEIKYYERDIKNHPNAQRVDDEGIRQVDTLMIDDLPSGLKAAETFVDVEFTAEKDGSLAISAVLVDAEGNKLHEGKMKYQKMSDVE